MLIRPISFDSLGTRSMATYIRTKDVKIFIDPGVSLAPRRYGLPPHPREYEQLERDWGKILNYATKSDIIIITHYHYDHHNPNEGLEIFEDKTVLLKHPTDHINFSQKKRAHYFLKQIGDSPKEIIYADGKEFKFGDTQIKISKPVPHGTNTKLGWVIQVFVTDGKERFLFTSDVEGPALDEQIEFILETKPTIMILDGPMTYMLGYRYSTNSYIQSLENIKKIINETNVQKLIIDHHFLRDLKWEERLNPIINIGKGRLITAAHYLNKSPNLLEANRKQLWENEPEA
ncbi:MAG: MBL fold metallo-hydrolase [Candidatus Njordarchaeia archaeon]